MDVAWQTALMRPLPPSPASRSPSKPSSRSPAAKCLAGCSQMHGEIVLQDVLCRETLAASTWEEDSDDETWESESFESTLSSIAAFDMAGALERMSSAEKFYTPEAADSVLLANGAFQDITCRPQAECSAPELNLAREKPSAYAPEAASAVKGSQEKSRSPEAEETVLAPTLARGEPVAATSVQSSSPGGSSDSDGGLSIIAWTVGRSMTRRHILDSPQSGCSQSGSPGATLQAHQQSEGVHLAAGSTMRKLVLPNLAESARTSSCLSPSEPHSQQSVQEQASALRYSSPEMSVSGVERPASECSQMGTAHRQHKATIASSESPELSSAPRLRQTCNRSLHVLEDSSEGDSSSQGSPAAAGSWASDSSAGEQDDLPGSSSGPALSSGLRSAVRQLGSSYRLGPSQGPLHGSPIRAHAGQSGGAQGPQACDNPTREAGDQRDIFELSDSEEDSPQRKPLRELNGQSRAPGSFRKPVDAPSQIDQAGPGPEPVTPHWKDFAGRKSRVNFMLDGAQTLPTLGKHVPRVLSTPVAPEEELPATPKTAPAPFYPTTPSKSRPDKTPVTVAAFRKRRIQLVASAFQEFNSTVFANRLPADLEIAWSAHLKTTAGTTHFRREPSSLPFAGPRYLASVQLATKVIDCETKLRATLLHELCHVATWVLPPHAAKPPHGPDFKQWAMAASVAHPDLPVTTCHQYDIHVPFHYQCLNPECAHVYKRHSKSIDTDRMACSLCSGRLMFRGKFQADGTPARARGPNAFSDFVREHFAGVKAAHPAGTPHKAVMAALSAKWRSQKAGADAGFQAGAADLGVRLGSLRL